MAVHDFDYSSDPDILLMLAFQKGNRPSFESLMRKYYQPIFNFTYRYTGSREIAEELTQETFLRVFTFGRRYKPTARFRTWLYTIAKHVSLSELRRYKKRMVPIDVDRTGDGGKISRQTEDLDAVTPYQELELAERIQAVRAAIDQLPSKQRMAVVLRRYERMSYEEIAVVIGCSVSAVKSLLNRAKERLRQLLEPHEGSPAQ